MCELLQKSVDRGRMHTVKISLRLTPCAEMSSLHSKNARIDKKENKKKKEKFSEKEDRTACRKDGAPDMKDNQITAHLPLTHSIRLCRSLETQE